LIDNTVAGWLFAATDQVHDAALPCALQEGIVLQDSDASDIRDILLVLIIAADHCSKYQDRDEYLRLLTFCKHVCTYFNGCTESGEDPFTEVEAACGSRIKTIKAAKYVGFPFVQHGLGHSIAQCCAQVLQACGQEAPHTAKPMRAAHCLIARALQTQAGR
jgi:hypothetical protein